ncbi:hypothetical protein I3843_04G171200 [Carya illinoinensis]|nr:hypothetical protein I3843_04G171200 [Carya illinoinensis]KAG7984657.1 hypothetical protein I3843_04G171200 [Carya illinoinensis]
MEGTKRVKTIKKVATSLRAVVSTPNLTNTFSSPILHAVYRKFPFSISLSSSHYISDPKILTSLSLQHRRSLTPYHSRRRGFAVARRDSENGAEPIRHYDFDLFTIGAWSGGVRASHFATNFGASVAICELPFSTISSETTGGVGGTHGFGWKYAAEPKHDWSTLIANKNAELQQLTGIYKNTLKNAGVTLIEGHGKIVDPHTVDVDGKLYSARQILVSVGDSEAALDLPSKPTKIAIIGGGYIANKVLRGFDEEIRDFVGEQMSLRGIEFHTEESPQAINKSADGSLSLKTNKGTVEGFSHVMFATRRRPNTKNLGLETDGVKMSKNGAIEVDEYSRTSVPSIWAVGDVTDRLYLTPVALMEGMALAKTLFKNEPTKPDYRTVPSAVFSSQPPIGQVGITEEQFLPLVINVAAPCIKLPRDLLLL